MAKKATKKTAKKKPDLETDSSRAAKGRKKTDGRAKGRPGRPPKGKSKVTPAVFEKIYDYHLLAMTVREIAKELGLGKSTVADTIKKRVGPVIKERLKETLEDDLAKTQSIERAGRKRYAETGDPDDLAMAKWAIEHRAKVAGHYSAPGASGVGVSDFRVAGKTAAEFDEETVAILFARIKERIERNQAKDAHSEASLEVVKDEHEPR